MKKHTKIISSEVMLQAEDFARQNFEEPNNIICCEVCPRDDGFTFYHFIIGDIFHPKTVMVAIYRNESACFGSNKGESMDEIIDLIGLRNGRSNFGDVIDILKRRNNNND